MFSSALKSFTSNISNNYQISPHASFTAGPWKVHDAKKKNTGNSASVFIFERKSLDPRTGGSLGSRTTSTPLKKVHEEVVERLKREAANLARLRHPSILQIIEPVEDSRNGGLMFATEPITTSLAGLLREKSNQERAGGIGGRSSRFVVEEPDGSRKRRDLEIDELEIQKGLLQIGKGLEFLHESAKLVHGNLNPEAIYINSKSDWKISGLSFAGPIDSGSQSPFPPLALSEVLYHDPRLPQTVQLDLDYTSPDFVIDSNISPAADLFSLGLIIVALYNSPHISPLQTNNNINTYKKLLSSASTSPTQPNSFLSSGPIPNKLTNEVLPKLITRRPAQRMNAKEFQQSPYFDNVLVSTIRFLDSFPAKTPNEKSQFMRGLSRVLPEFPSSVLERKVLGALLEQSKDLDLLPLILQNVFKILKTLPSPSSRRAVPEKIIPELKEIFQRHSNKASAQERDTSRDAGLMVVLENVQIIAENCSGKDFKDDMIPIVRLGLESSTHSLIDASMRCLPAMLPILDFSTVKDDVFPPIASVFSKTSSLAIKVRGLEAFFILCGGSTTIARSTDDPSVMMDVVEPIKPGSPILDKYTIQEKLVPLLKAMKTKEPAVMMAALNVFKRVGMVVDTEFIALEVLPIMWSFALGPLLNVKQFSSFMESIKSLSSKIESEQTKKLEQLSSNNGAESYPKNTANQVGMFPDLHNGNGAGADSSDFERLVLGKGKTVNTSTDPWESLGGSETGQSQAPAKPNATPQFSWSSSGNSTWQGNSGPAKPSGNSRSITPDMAINAFPSLEPGTRNNAPSISSMATLQPLSPQRSSGNLTAGGNFGFQHNLTQFSSSNANSPTLPTIGGTSSTAWQSTPATSSFSTIAPPPPTNFLSLQNHSTKSIPASGSSGQTLGQNTGSQQKQGLDKYDSLL